jgi:hypothetical protein
VGAGVKKAREEANAAAAQAAKQKAKATAKLARTQSQKYWRNRLAERTAEHAKAKLTARALRGFEEGLNVVGAGVTGWGQYQESTATTEWGRGADAVVAGLVDYRIGMTPFAVPDAAMSLALVPVGALGVNVKGLTLGDQTINIIRASVTLAEAGITGDNRGLATNHERSLSGEYGIISQHGSRSGEFISAIAFGDAETQRQVHERSLAGEYGPVFKAASQSGDYWAQHGVIGGITNLKYLFGD